MVVKKKAPSRDNTRKVRYYKTKDYPVGYWGESVVNAVRSAITRQPAPPPSQTPSVPSSPPVTSRFRRLFTKPDPAAKSFPSEMIEGVSRERWVDEGYPKEMHNLPTVREEITVRDTARREPAFTRPLNPSELATWRYQRNQRRQRQNQKEILAITDPGTTVPKIIQGDKGSVTIFGDPKAEEAPLGSTHSHPHPTKGGYLPTASEPDPKSTLIYGGSQMSVTSPKTVYSAENPNISTSLKYNTTMGRRILANEGVNTEAPLTKHQAQAALKKAELRENNVAKRAGRFFNQALDKVAEQYPEFGNDKVFPKFKQVVQITTTPKNVINDPTYKGWIPTSDVGIPLTKFRSYGLDLFPDTIDEGHIDRSKPQMYKWLEKVYTRRNKPSGITGLTQQQEKIVGALRNAEMNAYNNYREYAVGRTVYSVGGRYNRADFTKDDVYSGRPVRFEEVPQKANVIRDLRSEYRQTTSPDRHAVGVNAVGRHSNIHTSDRYTINKFGLPTVNVDKEYMKSVPATTKIYGNLKYNIGEKLEDIRYRHNLGDYGMTGTSEKSRPIPKRSLFDSRPDDPLRETRGIYPVSPQKKKKSNTGLDKQMEDILFGNPFKQSQSRSNYKKKKVKISRIF